MMRHTEAASTERDLSLAEWVASKGGLKIQDDEGGYIRELNRVLRGRRSVVRPTGQAFDLLALDAMDAGYPVDEFTFLEVLFQDALALSERHEVRGRVFASTKDWEDEVDELWAEYADYLAAEELEAEAEAEAAYVGNATSGVCHEAGCHHVERMAEHNRVELAEPTAEFRPCAHCQPKAYTLWKVETLDLEATTDELAELEAAAAQEHTDHVEALRLEIEGAKR